MVDSIKGFRKIDEDTNGAHSFTKCTCNAFDKFEDCHIGGLARSKAILMISENVKARKKFGKTIIKKSLIHPYNSKGSGRDLN